MTARSSFVLVRAFVKGVAIAGGGVLTLLSVMSVVGVVTANAYVRFLAASLFTVGVPAAIADRLLPGGGSPKARGLVSDVFAVSLLGFAFVFCGVAQPLTRSLLVSEGDRLAVSGFTAVAQIAYFFGGVRPESGDVSPATTR